MDAIDLEILRRVQDGIRIEKRPFSRVAEALSISETEVVERLENMKRSGIIRRFGSRINPRPAGITVHAMVVWRVPPDRVVEVGAEMAKHPEVTHCYERRTHPGRWEYNLYTVLHGYDTETVLGHIRHLARRVGAGDYRVLISTEEFKRVPAARIR
jgi:siroheme decarboxylase